MILWGPHCQSEVHVAFQDLGLASAGGQTPVGFALTPESLREQSCGSPCWHQGTGKPVAVCGETHARGVREHHRADAPNKEGITLSFHTDHYLSFFEHFSKK